MKKWLLDRGGLLALCVLAVYAWLAPADFVDGDNAEFSALAQLGGAAHPPGYPLYVLYLRATSWLPGASAAHTAALATAVLGAAAIFALHAACRAWGARPLAATIACAVFAASPVVATLHTQAEVFALANLIVAMILWLVRAPLGATWRAGALGLVAGLGLANHITCVLVAPIGLYGLAVALREGRGRAAVAAAGGIVVGLAPYLYLLAAPATPASGGAVDDAAGVLAMFLRHDYGGPFAFYAFGTHASIGAHELALVLTAARAWLYVGLALGLVTLVARARRGDERIAWLLLLASFLLAGPLLASRFQTASEGIGLYVVERFHVLPTLLLAIPVAVGLDRFTARLPAIAAWLAPALGLAAALAPSLPHIAAAHSPVYARYVENVLSTLPPDAVVLTTADELYFGGTYEHELAGLRRDVTIVNCSLLPLPWYRRRVEAWGVKPDRSVAIPIVRIARSMFAAQRPVFVDRELAHLLDEYESYPYGTLVRVLPPGSPRPGLDEIVADNRGVYDRFVLADDRPDAPWPREQHRMYAETWLIIARALTEAGRPRDAASAEAFARQVGPPP